MRSRERKRLAGMKVRLFSLLLLYFIEHVSENEVTVCVIFVSKVFLLQ